MDLYYVAYATFFRWNYQIGVIKMKSIIEDYLTELKNIPMFYGIKATEMESMFHCLGAYMKDIKRDDYVIMCGDDVNIVGIILSGQIHMIREDLWGNKSLLMSLEKGELFGETFACGLDQSATVSYIAASDVKVLFLTFSHIIHACSMSCKFHHRLIENMVALIALKNKQLMDKVDILSKKTLREKIASYLIQESGKNRSLIFQIPLGRVQLAEYLSVNRSALTRELKTMQSEGLIEYDGNSFRILRSFE